MKVQGLLSASQPRLGGSSRFARSLQRILHLESGVLLRYLREVSGDQSSKTCGQSFGNLAGRLVSTAHVRKPRRLIRNPPVQVFDVGLKFLHL